MASWLVPFKGRHHTGAYQQNFIWQSGNVYVMDNHRAAAWCWAQKIDQMKDHALIHIDRHNDALRSQMDKWIRTLPNGLNMSITDYLSLTYELEHGDRAPVFQWANYLSIYLELAAERVTSLILATHGEGDTPIHHNTVDLEPWKLLENFEFHVNRLTIPCILNLDLDYFFCTVDEQAVRLLDDDYFDTLSSIVAKLNCEGKLKVITIALTATSYLTGGWAPAEVLATKLCGALGHSFELPK